MNKKGLKGPSKGSLGNFVVAVSFFMLSFFHVSFLKSGSPVESSVGLKNRTLYISDQKFQTPNSGQNKSRQNKSKC